MKNAIIVIVASVAVLVFQGLTEIVAEYRMEKGYTQLWELADKSSTIPAKQKYVAEFVAALESGYSRGKFASHNAVWLETPNNGFEANLAALRSLSERLGQIQEMKPSSFEYNTAIAQITAQEQGEAKAMLSVFTGCFELAGYPMVWGWIGGALTTAGVMGILGVIVWGMGSTF